MVDIKVDRDLMGELIELQNAYLDLNEEMLDYRAKFEQLKYELQMFEPFGMDKEYIGKLLERVCKDE